MEAITIGGIAVVAVGGYYAVIDFMNDLGIRRRCLRVEAKRLPGSRLNIVARQSGIKKMAGLHI